MLGVLGYWVCDSFEFYLGGRRAFKSGVYRRSFYYRTSSRLHQTRRDGSAIEFLERTLIRHDFEIQNGGHNNCLMDQVAEENMKLIVVARKCAVAITGFLSYVCYIPLYESLHFWYLLIYFFYQHSAQ